MSHVSDTGEIFLQFHTKHFQILQALVEDITPEIVQANQIANLGDIDTEKLYLAKFTDDEWYRAAITNVNSQDDVSALRKELRFILRSHLETKRFPQHTIRSKFKTAYEFSIKITKSYSDNQLRCEKRGSFLAFQRF